MTLIYKSDPDIHKMYQELHTKNEVSLSHGIQKLEYEQDRQTHTQTDWKHC